MSSKFQIKSQNKNPSSSKWEACWIELVGARDHYQILEAFSSQFDVKITFFTILNEKKY